MLRLGTILLVFFSLAATGQQGTRSKKSDKDDGWVRLVDLVAEDERRMQAERQSQGTEPVRQEEARKNDQPEKSGDDCCEKDITAELLKKIEDSSTKALNCSAPGHAAAIYSTCYINDDQYNLITATRKFWVLMCDGSTKETAKVGEARFNYTPGDCTGRAKAQQSAALFCH